MTEYDEAVECYVNLYKDRFGAKPRIYGKLTLPQIYEAIKDLVGVSSSQVSGAIEVTIEIKTLLLICAIAALLTGHFGGALCFMGAFWLLCTRQ